MSKPSESDSDNPTMRLRKEHEPPPVIARRGWRYHHLGIPTKTIRPDEKYLSHLRMYVSGFETSPYGIEWMRFEPGCPIPDIVKTVPHIAFEVDDLDAELEGKDVLSEPSTPSEGIRVAMILDNNAPVELIEFSEKPT